MKAIKAIYNRSVGAVLLLAICLGGAADLRADSLASIFTNVQPRMVSAQRTSIILIRCHGLGYGDLSCYGQTNFATPNLDRLAAGGMRFTDFHAGGTDFDSALAVLMTGKNGAFASGATTAADRLKAAGYHTGLIGEWTLGREPWDQGFFDFAGFLGEDEGRDYFSDHIWRYAPKSDYNPTNKTVADWSGSEELYPNTNNKKGMYLPEVLGNATWRFVRDYQPDRFNHYQPFFLMVDFPAPRSAKAGADVFPVPSDAPYTDEPWPQAAKDRAAVITRLDGTIGELLQQLEARRLTNNVVILVTSSAPPEKFANPALNFLNPNGDATGVDAASRPAPMIAYWPDAIPAGKVSGLTWSGADVLPTLLQIAEAPPVSGLDGVSVLPVLLGETNQVNRP